LIPDWLGTIIDRLIQEHSDYDLEIRVEPEQQPAIEEDQSKSEILSRPALFHDEAQYVLVTLLLKVHYPQDYPDVIPDLDLATTRGELSNEEEQTLMDRLKATAEESIGMAMVFTLVSQLQESIQDLVSTRIKRREQEGTDAAKREIEKEEARTRGTPVTFTSFAGWKRKFDQERLRNAAQEDEEKMKAMSPKEREEYKKNKLKLTGRQIFERGKIADEEDTADEGGVSVDVSQYDRRAAWKEEEEETDHVHFSDSD